jgi:hypothetical protein
MKNLWFQFFKKGLEWMWFHKKIWNLGSSSGPVLEKKKSGSDSDFGSASRNQTWFQFYF